MKHKRFLSIDEARYEELYLSHNEYRRVCSNFDGRRSVRTSWKEKRPRGERVTKQEF